MTFLSKSPQKYLLQLSSIVVYWTEFCVKKVLKVYFAKSILCLNMHEVFLGIMRFMRDMLSRLFVYFLCIAHLCKTDHDGSVWSWKSVEKSWDGRFHYAKYFIPFLFRLPWPPMLEAHFYDSRGDFNAWNNEMIITFVLFAFFLLCCFGHLASLKNLQAEFMTGVSAQIFH